MQQQIESHHFTDDDGNPAGGTTYGPGFAIGWQHGPLGRPIDEETQAQIDACPEPYWHETHRYCPACPWMEDLGRQPPNGAFVETIITAAIDRLVFYQGGKFACEDNAEAIHHLDRALAMLNRRTVKREARGVEGTHGV